jgi:hypothetical protein
VGEPVTEDKPNDAPADAGQADEAPLAPEPETVMREAIAAEPEAPEGPAPEGTGDEEAEVVQGADDTSMAPVDDPVLKAFKADPRFANATFETAEDLFASVDNLRNRLSQRDEDAVLGREARGDWDAFKQFQQTQEAERQGQIAWNPPPKPVGIETELQKPEAERDPVKVEAYNKHVRYVNDRQLAWAEDPDLKLREHTLPAVVKVVGEMLAQQKRRNDLETALAPHEAYINKHGTELLELSKRMPVEDAIELHQLRRGTKPAAAAKARNADAATMASGKTGPRPSAAADAPPKEKVNLSDPASIMRHELGKGPVDPDEGLDLD